MEEQQQQLHQKQDQWQFQQQQHHNQMQQSQEQQQDNYGQDFTGPTFRNFKSSAPSGNSHVVSPLSRL